MPYRQHLALPLPSSTTTEGDGRTSSTRRVTLGRSPSRSASIRRTLPLAVADRQYQPPLYAMGPVYSTLTVTEGGVCVDERMRVLREDGEAIDGLYGAGGMAQSGMLLKGHGHHIAWVMSSGRLAGRDAAERANTQP